MIDRPMLTNLHWIRWVDSLCPNFLYITHFIYPLCQHFQWIRYYMDPLSVDYWFWWRDQCYKYYQQLQQTCLLSDFCWIVKRYMLRLNKYLCWISQWFVVYILSVYSPFPIGLDFLFITCVSLFMSFYHGHLLCRSHVWPYPLQHSLTMSFFVFQPVLCLQLYTPYIYSPSPHHMSITSQSTTSNESCDMLNSNQPSQFFIWHSVFQWDTCSYEILCGYLNKKLKQTTYPTKWHKPFECISIRTRVISI